MAADNPLPRRHFLGRIVAAFAGGALFGQAAKPKRAEATPQGNTNFVAEIRIFAGNFPPNGWAFCNGQLLPISQNTALFSLLLTTYGGDGQSSFALPDLRGRVPIQPGQGPGLSDRQRGEMGGEENHVLAITEMPQHTHTIPASSSNGSASSPQAAVLARTPSAIPQYAPTPDTNMASDGFSETGGDQPHNNMQPYLTLNYIIALQGIYPSRP